MTNNRKKVSNPASTGGAGVNFESQVAAVFVTLMLAGGFAPCMPCVPIRRIGLQASRDGFATDDLVVHCGKSSDKELKLLCQVKRSMRFTKSDSDCKDVIKAAWLDFNSDTFRNTDKIAVVTGLLTRSDTSAVRELLEWARTSADAAELLAKVNHTYFSSKTKQSKLEVFRHHLASAAGRAVSGYELHDFLCHFHVLGYDLDIHSGLSHALMHTLIGRDSSHIPDHVWAKIVSTVETFKQNGGTITRDNLGDLCPLFERATITQEEAMPAPTRPSAIIAPQYAQERALLIASFLGSWSDQSEADRDVLERLWAKDIDSLYEQLQQLALAPEVPLELKDGIWVVTDRMRAWDATASHAFDTDLDALTSILKEVLGARNPRFELPPSERFAASIRGMTLPWSDTLRSGLSTTLALLGSKSDTLTHCSSNLRDSAAGDVVRALLSSDDWRDWASVDDILPLAAEASPDQVLTAVDRAAHTDPCPFTQLYAQEGQGQFGTCLMAGLLWALETVAWAPDQLNRATLCLGALAELDPGGQWMNRPANSLSEIFLPWLPHTRAPITRRHAAIKALVRDFPSAAWDLLISLLPNEMTTSSGTRRPQWRQPIGLDEIKRPSGDAYWNDVNVFADLIVEMATADEARLTNLLSRIDHLPDSAFDAVLGFLESPEFMERAVEHKHAVWTQLRKVCRKHRRFPKADWSMPDELISRLEHRASALQPLEPQALYREYFQADDWDLHETTDWRAGNARLMELRAAGVSAILETDGLEGVLTFIDAVDSPRLVGVALARHSSSLDTTQLRGHLNSVDTKRREFAEGYIAAAFEGSGQDWLDTLHLQDWPGESVAHLLTVLPFEREIWTIANSMAHATRTYWKTVRVNPYAAQADLDVAITHLLGAGRPRAAIDCMAKKIDDDAPVDIDLAASTLIEAASSTERLDGMHPFHVESVISAIQGDSTLAQDVKCSVEIAYLSLLLNNSRLRPSSLEAALAADPDLFCKLIRTVFRSSLPGVQSKELSEAEKKRAEAVYRLLKSWRQIPGSDPEHGFDATQFNAWIDAAVSSLSESGHLNVGLQHIGSALIHAPPDPDGLWIHQAVAKSLDRSEMEQMRRGFSMGSYNSRGVHWFDLSGQAELDIANGYKAKADALDDRGFSRLAATLRSLADTYSREARRDNGE